MIIERLIIVIQFNYYGSDIKYSNSKIVSV